MKKTIVRVIIVLVILLVAGLFVVGMFLDSIIKTGVETAGPKIAKVQIKLDGVRLSLLSGKGAIKGLLVGNPEGYKTPAAVRLGEATVSLQPGSLMSDKIIIHSVNVQAPEITIEGGMNDNNLTKIMQNVQAFTGTETAAAKAGEAKPGKKLEVGELVITGGKVNLSLSLLGGKTMTVPLGDIHLKDLGKGPEGITPAELAKQVMNAVLEGATKAAGSAVSNLSKSVTDAAQDAEKITKGLGDLFKK